MLDVRYRQSFQHVACPPQELGRRVDATGCPSAITVERPPRKRPSSLFETAALDPTLNVVEQRVVVLPWHLGQKVTVQAVPRASFNCLEDVNVGQAAPSGSTAQSSLELSLNTPSRRVTFIVCEPPAVQDGNSERFRARRIEGTLNVA
jgi:hypothetical protein